MNISDERLAEMVGAGVPCVPAQPGEIAAVVQELRALRSKPVAGGAAEMQNAVCQALLDAFPMDDKIADNYAAVAVKALSALLPKATSPVVSEPAANKGEQRTICEACGNSNLAHGRAIWTDDGSSFCPSCAPQPEAVIEDRLPTREEAAAAAAILLRCNGHDLDVWTDGDFPDDDAWLKTLAALKEA